MVRLSVWMSVCLALIGCGGTATLPAGVAPAALAGQPAGTPRRVIQTFHYELRVREIAATEAAMTAAAARCGGYVAESSVQRSRDWGRWTIRLPVERQQAFLNELPQWGTVLGASTTGEDVSSQWIDVEARIAAKRVEESRLLKLLTESTGTLPDVLAVEQHLQRVREEIEQAERRRASLENATTFSTVQITATAELSFAWSASQPLAAQATTVFRQSCFALMQLVRFVVIALAALLPWLMLALALVAPWWYRRRVAQARLWQTK